MRYIEPQPSRKSFFRYFPVALLLVVALQIVNQDLFHIDDYIRDLKFMVRGQTVADSSIVVIYLDNQDINNLGGYPIPRIYYATLLHALDAMDVAAVGLDVLFERPDRIYPEYDTLLVDAVRSAGNVVLGCYAREENVVERGGMIGFRNEEVVSSFETLVAASAGYGATNLPSSRSVRRAQQWYEVIRADAESGPDRIPAFAYSLLRVARANAQRPVDTITFSSEERNGMLINFAGDRMAFRMYPFISFLKSYDSLLQGYDVSFRLNSFRNTIVVVGFIAEGRSQYVRTPASDNLPALLVHAALLDTIVGAKKIRSADALIITLLAILVTVPFLLLRKNRIPSIPVYLPTIFFLVFLILDVLVFVLYRVDIPVFAVFLCSMLLTAHQYWLGFDRLRSTSDTLRESVRVLERDLHDRSREISSLRNLMAQAEKDERRERELEERIGEYEREIVQLRERIDEYARNPEELPSVEHSLKFEGIVYSAASSMVRIVEQIRAVTQQDVTVLLQGESGTGKELAARAIHRLSGRSARPFLALNCGALSETLLESELFGHEKGAFTGAVKSQPGRFERAHGGTLFLDEIADTSEAFQIKLLRVIQEGEYERVGGTQTVKVDTRIIAASNKDLKKLVSEGKFREDLFYRLYVFPIVLPPLRDRREDIPHLISHILARYPRKIGCSVRAADALRGHDWPGNIREMESVLTRAALMAETASRDVIHLSDLPAEMLLRVRRQSELGDLVLDLLRAKEFARGSINEVARELGGMDRSTITEYYRGIVFESFTRCGFEIDRTVEDIAHSHVPAVLERVEKKVREYLAYLQQEIDVTESEEALRGRLHQKFKNLPQKYHGALDSITEHYLRRGVK